MSEYGSKEMCWEKTAFEVSGQTSFESSAKGLLLSTGKWGRQQRERGGSASQENDKNTARANVEATMLQETNVTAHECESCYHYQKNASSDTAYSADSWSFR